MCIDHSKVAVVDATQENKHYFDDVLIDTGLNLSEIDVIGQGDSSIDWSIYGVVLIMSGKTEDLYDWLHKTSLFFV